MDYWSALGVLGLASEEGLTRESVRRTYMRKLRQHSPEKDPEGFRRLREAFERVRDWLPEDGPAAIEPPRIQFKIEEPPKIELRAPLPPIAAPIAPESLETMVPRLIGMLEKGELAQAVALEEKWRGEADDFRRAHPLLLVRWELVRELLYVAHELPPEVVQHLAYGLSLGDLSAARPRLIEYRLANEKRAGEASTALFLRAPSLAKQVEGTLWVPRQIPNPFENSQKLFDEIRRKIQVPPPRKSSTGSGLVLGGLLVVAALARLMIGSTPSTPTYKPIQIPQFHYQPLPEIPKEMFFIPPRFPGLILVNETNQQMLGEILDSAKVMQTYEITSPEQKAAAAELEKFAAQKSCAGMKSAFRSFDGLPSHESRRFYADMHLRAIGDRLAHVCPEKKKPK